MTHKKWGEAQEEELDFCRVANERRQPDEMRSERNRKTVSPQRFTAKDKAASDKSDSWTTRG